MGAMRYHGRMMRIRRAEVRARWPRPIVALAILAASAAPGAIGPDAQPAAIVVEDWAKQPAGRRGVPDGWKAQNWGAPKYDFEIVGEGLGKALLMKSENEGSTINKEIKVDVTQYPYLTWRWKAIALPQGADSRKAATDDQACQIYVTFPRFPTAVRSRILGYIWDTSAPGGTMVTSQKTSTVTYFVVRSGPAELGRWITETRNVLEDFKKAHGGPPAEEVGAVSVGIDSNDTHDRAECAVGEIAFKKQA